MLARARRRWLPTSPPTGLDLEPTRGLGRADVAAGLRARRFGRRRRSRLAADVAAGARPDGVAGTRRRVPPTARRLRRGERRPTTAGSARDECVSSPNYPRTRRGKRYDPLRPGHAVRDELLDRVGLRQADNDGVESTDRARTPSASPSTSMSWTRTPVRRRVAPAARAFFAPTVRRPEPDGRGGRGVAADARDPPRRPGRRDAAPTSPRPRARRLRRCRNVPRRRWQLFGTDECPSPNYPRIRRLRNVHDHASGSGGVRDELAHGDEL